MSKEINLGGMKVHFRLTNRETDVLKCLFEGMKNAHIADNLAIGEQTVKDHLSKIYKKIGVKNRFDLMRSIVRATGRKARTARTQKISAAVPAEKTSVEKSLLTDELTGMHNHVGFLALADQQMKIARRQKRNVCILHAKVEKPEATDNAPDTGGKEVLLKDTAKILKDTFRESDVIARVGGDEFAVIPLGTTEDDADLALARLRENIELFNSKRNGDLALSISCGAALCNPGIPCSIDDLLSREEKDKDKN